MQTIFLLFNINKQILLQLMTDIQEIDFNMLVDTHKTMVKFKSVWEQNINIVLRVDSLNATIKQIRGYNAKKRKNPKDMTLTKKELRIQLIKEAFIIKQALVIYYQINNMTDEMELLTYSKSALTKLTDDAFYLACINVQTQAIALALMLAPFGITQEKIDQLSEDIIAFGLLQPQIELAKKKYSNLIKLIDTKIKASMLMLRQSMDVLVSVYEDTSEEFVTTYKLSRRKLKKSGKHKTYQVTITGKVTDSITKQPLEGIILLAGKKLKTITTDIKGIYKIKVYKKDADFITFNGSKLYLKKSEAIPKKSIKDVVTVNVALEQMTQDFLLTE